MSLQSLDLMEMAANQIQLENELRELLNAYTGKVTIAGLVGMLEAFKFEQLHFHTISRIEREGNPNEQSGS